MKNLRRQIVLHGQHAEYLEREADRLGITMTEVVRRLIDLHRGVTGVTGTWSGDARRASWSGMFGSEDG